MITVVDGIPIIIQDYLHGVQVLNRIPTGLNVIVIIGGHSTVPTFLKNGGFALISH